MKTLATLKEELEYLDKNIAQGKRFEEQGYDCSGMIAITESIRAGVIQQIKEAETMSELSGYTELPDSGERRQFETGAVRDMAVKGRCDLLPWDAFAGILPINHAASGRVFCQAMYLATHHDDTETSINEALDAFIQLAFSGSVETAVLEVAFLYQKGAKKYGGHNGRNWELGIPVDSFLDSAGRHFLKYLRGDHDERHDQAVVWNLLGALWTVHHHPEMIDAAVDGVT